MRAHWNMPSLCSAQNPDLIIFANSAHVLASSAVRGGYTPCAYDFFCDRDTADLCLTKKLPLLDGLSADASEILSDLESISDRQEVQGFVIGPGLEDYYEFFPSIAGYFHFFGNTQDTLRLCRDKQRAVHLADKCGIPTVKPIFSGVNIRKPRFSSGGIGICFAEREEDGSGSDPAAVLQAYVPGPTLSHLFLSNGSTLSTVGFSYLWQSTHDAQHPFVFGGAVAAGSNLDDHLKNQMESWSLQYSQQAGLLGLNNIDYILCGGDLQFLECNPNPSSTMVLYDDLYPKGLLLEHIRACQHQPIQKTQDPLQVCRAFAIVYAPKEVAINPAFAFPEGSWNIPQINSTIKAHQPLCSIGAKEKNMRHTLENLQRNIRCILSQCQ